MESFTDFLLLINCKTNSFENPVVKYLLCPDIKKKLAREWCQKHVLGDSSSQRPAPTGHLTCRQAWSEGMAPEPGLLELWLRLPFMPRVASRRAWALSDLTLRAGPLSFSAAEPWPCALLRGCPTSQAVGRESVGRRPIHAHGGTASARPAGALCWSQPRGPRSL